MLSFCALAPYLSVPYNQIMDQQEQTQSWVQIILDLLESFVIALLIFVVMYTFVAQPHRVSGDSMLPNFHDREFILTEKVSYRFSSPKRGDVIVLKYPENPDADYIKRIIGLPNEKLLISNGTIFINDEPISEIYLPRSLNTNGSSIIKEGVAYTIPDDEYVVMGDNRNKSSDSRSWGTVPEKLIVGKAFFVYWPMTDFGFVTMASTD